MMLLHVILLGQHQGLQPFKELMGDLLTISFLLKTLSCVRSTVFQRPLCCGLYHTYVFNLEYEKKVKDVAVFLQEFVFGLPDTSGTKKSASYLTITSDVQAFAHTP